MSIEIGLPTKRPFPIEILETFNWQTDKDFKLKILVRGSQPWTEDDLKKALNFPVEVYPQTLYYSTGTRYASALALNELVTHLESKYVFLTEDYTVINPRSVEIFRKYAQEDLILQGHRHHVPREWTTDFDFVDYRDEFEGKPREYPLLPTTFISLINTVIPVNLLRKVNGFDCTYDGQWGVMEIDLKDRLLRAGYTMKYVMSLSIHTFKHRHHSEESDDPPISDELFVYNKETGARNYDIKHCWPSWGGSAQYRKWTTERGTIEAPFGLREVENLLEG